MSLRNTRISLKNLAIDKNFLLMMEDMTIASLIISIVVNQWLASGSKLYG